MKQLKVVIIGGGVAGLTVAHELAERGNFQIELYEKNNILGGKARSITTPEGFPAEHSLRSIGHLYFHLRNTLSRIPFNGGTLLDNVVPTIAGSRNFLLFKDHDEIILPRYFPWNIQGFSEYLKFKKSFCEIIPEKEIIKFAWNLYKILCMCPERLFSTWEDKNWKEFYDVTGNKSEAAKKYLFRLPQYVIGSAQKGKANARSVALMMARVLFSALIYPIASQHSTNDVFNGPSSDVFIMPWVDLIKKKEVKFYLNSTATEINVENGKVKNIIIKNEAGNQQNVTADIYVLALPLEVLQQLSKKKDLASIPSLAKVQELKTYFANGFQFFNTNPNNNIFPKGWTLFMDSPWAVLCLYQSNELWPHYKFAQPIVGALSVVCNVFDEPGILYNKPAKDCSPEEIKNELLAQMRMHKRVQKFIEELQIHSWYIDSDLIFDETKSKIIGSDSNLFMALPGSWQYQPECYTEIDNLFLAADYVKTTYDEPTMESANEAGRKAVNSILSHYSPLSKLCYVLKEPKTGMYFFQLIDKLLFKLGL